MAELLIVVVVVVVLLLGYAADRARKLRVRARQMSGMNNRLDAAAAKVDKEQQQRRARVMASAELTSVMPAIKRPPLTIPGMAGHGDEPEEQDEPAEPEAAPEASPAAEASTSAEAGTPAPAGSPADAPDAPDPEPAPASADAVPAGVPAPPAPRLADDTLGMPAGLTADDLPAVSKIQVTTEGTLIMRPVPDQGRAPAGKVMPAPDGMTDEPAATQKRADRR